MSENESIYQLKITLRHIRPPIWRRVQVQGDASLGELHYIIQRVMDWHNSHLHEFITDGLSYGMPDPELEMDVEDENSVTLAEVLHREKQKITYIYDFGDHWEHEILLEKKLPAEEGVNYPVCITGKRAAPPEDCGGPWGYADLLESLADPDHPEHDEYLEWLGGRFDPERFDLASINRALQAGDFGTEPRLYPQIGQQPPKYNFILNPYEEARFTRCPQCDELTRLRKYALLIHIDDFGLVALGKQGRFCPSCDILIVHQDELEEALKGHLNRIEPDAVDNEYLVLGTVERKVWRRGMKEDVPIEEMLKHASDFASVLEVHYEPGGWYREG